MQEHKSEDNSVAEIRIAIMKSNTLKKLHKYAAVCAFLLIVTFFTSTVVADLWGDLAIITQVKQGILSCVSLLVVAMMTTGITAKKLYRTKPTGGVCRKRDANENSRCQRDFYLDPSGLFSRVMVDKRSV